MPELPATAKRLAASCQLGPVAHGAVPVRRPVGASQGVVYGTREDLDAWLSKHWMQRPATPRKAVQAEVKIGEIVDANLKTRIDNLYVCDCSVIPEAWGLPPTFTLVAFGKRLARHLVAEQRPVVHPAAA